MIKVATPRTLETATAACDAVAHLDARIAAIGGERDASIARINAAADAVLAPLIEERAAHATALQTWWAKAGAQLLKGKRKTLELGGCIIGTKAAAASLSVADGDWDALVAKLRTLRWAKPYVRVKHEIDKKAAKAALDGKHAEQLRDLGVGTSGGGKVFVLEAVKQAGTVQAKG